MGFDGIEVDMFSVGNADSILVTRWEVGVAPRVLIDGANPGSSEEIVEGLISRGIRHLEHVVSTHHHDDHAGGLPGIIGDPRLTFGRLWMHQPARHLNATSTMSALRKSGCQVIEESLRKSFETASEVMKTASARNIPVSEPFTKAIVGFLNVCGPTQEYYEKLLSTFLDPDKIKQLEESFAEQEFADEQMDVLAAIVKSESLLENPQTSPENNASVILATMFKASKYVFTADAGAEALHLALKAYQIGDCAWFQLPHHGSYRNITKGLIQIFNPKTVFVSAKGNNKHPRRAVVNACKEFGANVYSTHYPDGLHLWRHEGHIPERGGYSAAISLWNAE
jgi:beta-lactamase superfamily II metal-dependent hydrolase